MGCCVQRGKLDYNVDTGELLTLNTIPTLENLQYAYEALDLPTIDQTLLRHRKELMIMMIINLLRVRPKLFLYQVENMRVKYQGNSGSKPRTMMLYSSDVEACINLLQMAEPMQPLEVSHELCRLTQA